MQALGPTMLTLLVMTATVIGDAWNLESIDPSGSVFYHALALDGLGNDHIVHSPNTLVFHTGWIESGWVTDTVFAGYNMTPRDIAVDADGTPHIAFGGGYTSGDVMYAAWSDSTWETACVDPFAELLNLSFAVTEGGTPWIAYYSGLSTKSGSSALVVATQTGSEWSLDTLCFCELSGGDNSAWRPSIALTSGDAPCVAFLDGGDLMCGTWTGSDWQIAAVDTLGATGYHASLAMDSGDAPHISYSDRYGANNLKYAWWSGSSWNINIVDQHAHNGTSLALDADDHPRIAYEDDLACDLMYASWTGSGWETTRVDSLGHTVLFPSLALDPWDRPHITYGGVTTGLHYAWLNAPPSPFDLLAPAHESGVTDTPTMLWQNADCRVSYDLWYALDPDFDPHWEMEGLSDTSFTFPEGYLVPGATYHWKVLARDLFDGYQTWCTAPGGGSGETFWTIHVNQVGISRSSLSVGSDGPMLQIHPNPSRGAPTLTMRLTTETTVSLAIYDLAGRTVASIEEDLLPAGDHSLTLQSLPSGVYVCRLDACGQCMTRRMVIVR